ncbi:MAG: hypothetical protein KDC98_01205 [Planctomycetes bacterium]|nr:hypothetical protein [Planctomycetota bacterium]
MILQVVDGNQDIQWQRYFYGWSPSVDNSVATAARAISVWPAATPQLTRIAICGESFDKELPLSQVGGPAPVPDVTTGFIAVYDGQGTLLWTHHFYADNVEQYCTVTDLSVRVEVEGEMQYDVVTYCGMSTHGLVTSGPLMPVAPFTNVASTATYNPGLGNTQTGAGQWDGFVGRLRRPTGGPTATDFHSIVGGSEQDSLYGLAELTETDFVVTGATRKDSVTPSQYAFPFTKSYDFSSHPFYTDWNDAHEYSVGTLSLFSLQGTGLVLFDSYWIGTVTENPEEPTWTVGHDVAAIPYIYSYYTVGTTNDRTFLPTMQSTIPGSTVANGSKSAVSSWATCDGFVLWSGSGTNTVGLFGSDEVEDGFCGVAMWSEFWSYAAFAGWENPATGWTSMRCGSFSEGGRGLTVPGPSGKAVREATITASGLQIPARAGDQNVFAGPTGAPSHVLDEPPYAPRSNGGIAIDQRGRVNVVGYTFSDQYPYLAPGSGFLDGRQPGNVFIASDAVRTTMDMVPLGVSRTEGTGAMANGSLPVQPPASGYTGATTPVGTCQSPFGWQVGVAPSAEVNRLLIDYAGPAPGSGLQGYVVLEGVFGSGGLALAALQIGLPGITYSYDPLGIGGSTIELWTVNNPVFVGPGTTGLAHEEILLPIFAPGSWRFTLQGLWALSTPLSCDPAGLIASPALVIDY